ncbi:two-component sensor histidine kinase [Malaciobacter pacificus]|uniref:histidine kinase n=1 Tax=Malaciobacter pacificus TaxID=1080223 RepID=A0A5C2H2S4_9BACT|nr:HAMP domain-containing sensor histidine kinase [Malaciobacter pacificus]QEP33257.1 two-component system sensor histidine kinase, putative CusS [Malaciobacter pacificus]GGD41369.1 two-component sensor histidine kinase [Malaciobacter pacificus]
MDIDLTVSEKSTFFRFLVLYLGSSFILMLIVAILYFQNEKTLYTDLIKSEMQNITSKVSNEIIYSHMMGSKFEKEKYLESKQYQISFYDFTKRKLYGTLDEKIDFTKKFTFKDDEVILVDNSTVGHLGIEYVVLKDTSLNFKIEKLKISILWMFLLSCIFVSFIGFYLSKLFLKPLKEEREKLNNFIKDTTHELNTPISAIMMSSENEELNSKQIQRIRLSAKRISEIYKDLTYIFLEEKEKTKELKEIDISKIIKEQIDGFEPLYSKKRIEVEIKVENMKYMILEDDFIRLFNNLFSNAIKYNKLNGKIEIILKDKTLIIKDWGIGIKEEKIKDIYNRYYRATSLNGGFGLGLNIVNMICKKYNIKIEVSSQENIGTTFKLLLN